MILNREFSGRLRKAGLYFALLLLAPVWILLLALLLVFLLVWTLVAFVAVHLAVWAVWLPRGKRLLFVTSDSPNWQTHIETHILPRIRDQAVVLNWSERRRWPSRPTLAVTVFRLYGGRREFNPMAVVFRPLRFGRTFRFFQPFRHLKRGKPESLARIESEFFQYLQKHERGDS